MEVKQIESKDTLKLRHDILRPHQDIAQCIYPKDDDEGTFHLGAYENNELVSVASFYMENSNLIDADYQYRLRGMATLDKYQKQGMSKALLNTAFPLILRNNIKIVWCNARVPARGFYEKVGFKATGDTFFIDDIGEHILMYKELN